MRVIEKYGVVLRELIRDKIELVRYWRNHPKISQYMQYRQYITPEMQEQWYHAISCSNTDYYFIIEYGGREIGLINIKDIDYGKGCGEQGIFIWDSDYLDTGVAFLAFYALDDFCIEELNIHCVSCHILKTNTRAIRFDEYLGFRLCEGQAANTYQLYHRTLDPNDPKRLRIIKTLYGKI